VTVVGLAGTVVETFRDDVVMLVDVFVGAVDGVGSTVGDLVVLGVAIVETCCDRTHRSSCRIVGI